jgi:glycosyltransferase involved in cell wall biosynthesis
MHAATPPGTRNSRRGWKQSSIPHLASVCPLPSTLCFLPAAFCPRQGPAAGSRKWPSDARVRGGSWSTAGSSFAPLHTPAQNAPHSPRPARVLLVSGPASGGIRRHLEELAEYLPAYQFEPALAAPASLPLRAVLPRFGVEIGDRLRPTRDLLALGALRGAVSEWRPDLVHAHGVKAALLALLLPLPRRPPVLVTFHNLWRGGPLTHPLRRLAPRAVAVAVSAAVRDSLAAAGVRPRVVTVIPNGVALDRFPAAPPPTGGHRFTAAFVGRLTIEKGVQTLLQLVWRFQDRDDLRVLIAGDGPLRTLVEREARTFERVLEYVGEQDDILSTFHAADAVLVPSLSEGFGLAALEGMACALPVVASRVGGLPDLVSDGETGFLVPPGDGVALARAVEVLARDPALRRRMGVAGRRRVEAEFTRERMLERLAAVYRSLLT